jgi:hypothetical protein
VRQVGQVYGGRERGRRGEHGEGGAGLQASDSRCCIHSLSRVADPRRFNADPDSDFYINADPDPAFYFNANPNATSCL